MGNSLVVIYEKCGSIEDACKVFNKIPSRDVVTWTTMILGHMQCGQGQNALILKNATRRCVVKLCYFCGVLNACASVIALEEGRIVHDKITEKGCEFDVFVGSSLVDMYAKPGNTKDD